MLVLVHHTIDDSSFHKRRKYLINHKKSPTVFDCSLSHNSSMIVTCRLLVSIKQQRTKKENEKSHIDNYQLAPCKCDPLLNVVQRLLM